MAFSGHISRVLSPLSGKPLLLVVRMRPQVMACHGRRLERRRNDIGAQVRRCEEFLQRRSAYLAQKRAFLKQKHAHLQADILAQREEVILRACSSGIAHVVIT